MEIKLDDFARPTGREDRDLIGIAWGIVPIGHRRREGPVRIDWDLLLSLMTAVGVLDQIGRTLWREAEALLLTREGDGLEHKGDLVACLRFGRDVTREEEGILSEGKRLSLCQLELDSCPCDLYLADLS